MDLRTTWLGFELPHPFVPGASPLADDLDAVRRLEDAGAPMIVMRSLFEEQIVHEQMSAHEIALESSESYGEALSYQPDAAHFRLGPDEYLEHLRRVREAVGVPVVASLNGATPGGWLRHAELLEQAGAHALELNLYTVPTDSSEPGARLEEAQVEMLRGVKQRTGLPVAVKLSPFYTALTHFAHELQGAGADALVIFNRFYQPDIDIEALDVVNTLHLSTSEELPLRLRWLAILSARLDTPLAVTGGVQDAPDAIKALMCGATSVQLVSTLLRHGVQRLGEIRDGVARWLVENEYESLAQLRGSMDMRNCPDAAAYERGNYVDMLLSWRPAEG